MNLTLLK